jgi:hypothetical protein
MMEKMNKELLPDFIIVGAAKSGTTSLYHYISSHPDLYMSIPKEINFFSSQEIKKQNLYYDYHSVDRLDEYKKCFQKAKNSSVIGEGSVSYLSYPSVPGKIKDLLPDVKILILLRSPVERAFSHYLMDYRMGLIDCSFEDVVYRRSPDKKFNLFFQQHIELGLYHDQVKRYLDVFGHKQVKIFLQEDLRDSKDKTMKDIFNFLEVDVSYEPDMNQEHNTFSMPKNALVKKLYSSYFNRFLAGRLFSDTLKKKLKKLLFHTKAKPSIKPETSIYLHRLYEKDILNLEVLIARDLSSWKKSTLL